MTAELENSKKKFKALNTEYHDVQEHLTMKGAELDSIRNR
jgi:hypothetical protein